MWIKCLLLLCIVNLISSARILIVLPSPSLSHHLFYRPIIKELSLRGHDVVSISPDPIKDPKLRNLTEIDVHDETYGTFSVTQWLEESQKEPESQMAKFRKYSKTILTMSERILSAPKVKQLIEDKNEHFDLFIIEMLCYPLFFGFKEHFKCPLVGLSSLDTLISGMDAVGNPSDPNYYASLFVKGYPNANFWERLELLWHQIDYRIFYHLELIPEANELAKKYFNLQSDSLWDLEKTTDLILTNTNPIFHMPRPHVPAYIEIGGLHQRERKPLPKDLKTFLDDSTNGVVYFSLGSNVKSENLPENIRNSILKAFEQLPFNILWKWENNSLSDKPKNVLIKQWLPQQDVLDHPNLRAFVTQGGLQSLEEAIQGQVPMVGIPFGGDQEFNVNRLATLEIGREIHYGDITTELLVESIVDVATNPKYKENIKNVASLIWDQQTKPLDRAIWWIEYVIRHKGAQHLRSPAADLPWYKYLLLDILGFILAIVLLVLLIFIYFIKFIYKSIFSTKKKYKKN